MIVITGINVLKTEARKFKIISLFIAIILSNGPEITLEVIYFIICNIDSKSEPVGLCCCNLI